MNKETLINELKPLLQPYVQDKEAFESLHEKTDFINDLKINSANLVDVILDIEDKYDIEIDNQSMEQMLNVEKAIEVIQAKIAK